MQEVGKRWVRHLSFFPYQSHHSNRSSCDLFRKFTCSHPRQYKTPQIWQTIRVRCHKWKHKGSPYNNCERSYLLKSNNFYFGYYSQIQSIIMVSSPPNDGGSGSKATPLPLPANSSLLTSGPIAE